MAITTGPPGIHSNDFKVRLAGIILVFTPFFFFFSENGLGRKLNLDLDRIEVYQKNVIKLERGKEEFHTCTKR